MSIGHVAELTLLAASTVGGRPVAHGARTASGLVGHGGAVGTTAELIRIPHAAGIQIARRLSGVGVTTSFLALTGDGVVGQEAAHGVGGTSDGESSSGVVEFVLVERRALACAGAGLAVPHAVGRSVADGLT